MTTRLEQIKARLEKASNLKGATWDGVKINEEVGYTHVPECSTLGDTLIMLSHDYEGDGEDCIFLQNAYSDLASLLRVAEAAERWEEARQGVVDSENNYPYKFADAVPDDTWNAWKARHNAKKSEVITRTSELELAVRAFREGGGEE